ncbi:12793_t:CDS:1, partial [Gigaspora rosea]
RLEETLQDRLVSIIANHQVTVQDWNIWIYQQCYPNILFMDLNYCSLIYGSH